MFKNASFENLHPNHKSAFADGLLTGFVIMFFVRLCRKDARKY